MKADLHIHSRCSDGSDSPSEIVVKAKRNGLGCIAVTDHDAVDGTDEAIEAGKKAGLQVIAGVELSTYSVTDVHILGYRIDVNNAELRGRLAALREKRLERIDAILDKLAEQGIKLDRAQIESKDGSTGRPHVAKLLIAKGYAANMTEAFDRYLGENGSAYVPSKRMTPVEGVRLILAAGGVPVLAHPMLIKQKGRLEDLIRGLAAEGLGGIETYYPSHTQADIAALRGVAARFGMITTGGSDYHGQGKAGDIGCSVWTVDRKTADVLGIKIK